VLRLAASVADGIPVDLRDAMTGMDAANVDRAVQAMLHAAGRPSTDPASPGFEDHYAGQLRAIIARLHDGDRDKPGSQPT
jgi:hypothetical protein